MEILTKSCHREFRWYIDHGLRVVRIIYPPATWAGCSMAGYSLLEGRDLSQAARFLEARLSERSTGQRGWKRQPGGCGRDPEARLRTSWVRRRPSGVTASRDIVWVQGPR